jgi:hypothetical protein
LTLGHNDRLILTPTAGWSKRYDGYSGFGGGKQRMDQALMSEATVSSINERAADEYFRRGLEAEEQGNHEKAAEFTSTP